jgi:hypothetical protein
MRWCTTDIKPLNNKTNANIDHHLRVGKEVPDGFGGMASSVPVFESEDDELDRRRRRRSGDARTVHNAGGLSDVMVDGGHAASLLREQASNLERPSGLVGYEAGDPIIDDEEADDA